MIIIYHLKDVKGEIRFVEYDRWNNGQFLGKLKGQKMSKEEVINRYNRGYWKTSWL